MLHSTRPAACEVAPNPERVEERAAKTTSSHSVLMRSCLPPLLVRSRGCPSQAAPTWGAVGAPHVWLGLGFCPCSWQGPQNAPTSISRGEIDPCVRFGRHEIPILFFSFGNFYFEMTSNLQKSCKQKTKNIQIPQLLTFTSLVLSFSHSG